MQHHAIVRITLPGISRMMNTVKLRRDEEAMHERRNPKVDVRVIDIARDEDGDERGGFADRHAA